MKTTRRFAVAPLLVLAVAVVLGAPAPAAAGPGKHVTLKLYPAADSPSPNAIGTVTLYPSSGWANYYYDGVSVSVSKLAPNASYYMMTGFGNVGIQTDARGKGEGGWYRYGAFVVIPSLSFQVYDSSGTLVLTSSR